GMLLCADREQRIVYILGEIFGATDRVGAELLDVSRANYRQKLARARRDLHHFMQRQCGLINAANPCRCARKTQGFIKAGYIDPRNLLFARARLTRVRDVAGKRSEDLQTLDPPSPARRLRSPPPSPPSPRRARSRRRPAAAAGAPGIPLARAGGSMLRHVVLATTVAASSAAWTVASPEDATAQIVALERGALDRWGKGDPGGYLRGYDREGPSFE